MEETLKIKFLKTLTFLLIISFSPVFGQSVQWKRTGPAVKPDLQLFHSTQTFNLPTAETMQKSVFEFEISHRFIPPITEGVDFLYGLDGPVNMRLGLGFALTNRLVITLARSNVDDNVDLQIKHKTFQFYNSYVPVLIGLQIGTAWNTGILGREKTDSQNFQYYGRVIFNTLLIKKIGLGIVPAYIYHSDIFSIDTKKSFTVGSYVQYYIFNYFSILTEWNPHVSGFRKPYNSVSFGIELGTSGHFFKILLTNNGTLNPTQFSLGADLPAVENGDWRLGFNVTRLLKF